TPGAAKPSASFNFVAQSSQHTSTVLPQILTWIGLSPSSPSQAAQVVFVMTHTSMNARRCLENIMGRSLPLSDSLATCARASGHADAADARSDVLKTVRRTGAKTTECLPISAGLVLDERV